MSPVLQRFDGRASLKSVIAAVEQDGAVVLENVLSQKELNQLRLDSDHELGKTKNCDGVFFGYETKRVGTMIAKSCVSPAMTLKPVILKIMDHFLLPHCDQYQLNLSQLIAIGSGERQQIIHPDDPMFPFDHDPSMQLMINVMWAIDDFTIQNGATHVALGSHMWGRDRHPEDAELMQAEMKAGSCLVYLGSTRHGGGANYSLEYRRGLVISYSLGWLKPSENYFLAIPKSTVRTYPKRLQELVGYFVHKPNLNMIDGRDPMEYLHSDDSSELLSKGFRDYMPPSVEELLNRHYQGENIAVSKV